MAKKHGTNRAVFISRALDICLLMHGGKKFSARTIAEHFDVCKRTGYRYLAACCEVMPVITDKIGSETFYYIPESMRKLRRSNV
jgi:predicted DNA-binding transcriptional regulator YafY